VNVGQIKTSVKRFGFEDTDPLLDWINEANAQFVEAFDWPWLKKTLFGFLTPGTNTLPILPPLSAMPISVVIGVNNSSVPLSYKSFTEFATTTLFTDLGVPRFWTKMSDTQFFVAPIPDQDYGYTMYYTAAAETFTADTDIPLIPLRYHFALVRGAAAIGLDTENQEDRAATQQQRFQDIIDRALTYYSSEQRGSLGRIRNVRD
jgi:hypothetical protein